MTPGAVLVARVDTLEGGLSTTGCVVNDGSFVDATWVVPKGDSLIMSTAHHIWPRKHLVQGPCSLDPATCRKATVAEECKILTSTNKNLVSTGMFDQCPD